MNTLHGPLAAAIVYDQRGGLTTMARRRPFHIRPQRRFSMRRYCLAATIAIALFPSAFLAQAATDGPYKVLKSARLGSRSRHRVQPRGSLAAGHDPERRRQWRYWRCEVRARVREQPPEPLDVRHQVDADDQDYRPERGQS